uniref:hypothetical protein n=1 Tax=Escherichia coli TaxID=562 RepID=UPI0019538AE2
ASLASLPMESMAGLGALRASAGAPSKPSWVLPTRPKNAYAGCFRSGHRQWTASERKLLGCLNADWPSTEALAIL